MESLPNRAAMPKLLNLPASKAWQVLSTKKQNINKTAACSHYYPLWHENRHWALVYRVYLRIYDPGPSNPTIFLGLCSPSDYRQPIEFPMGILAFNLTEKVLIFTIYDYISRLEQKSVIFDEIYSFGFEVYLSSDIWRMC